MESSTYDQTKDVSDHIDQPSVTPNSQTTDNSSSKFSDSLSTQVDLTFTSKGLHIANNKKKFRSFKSKENIHKKEVGPYRDFGY